MAKLHISLSLTPTPLKLKQISVNLNIVGSVWPMLKVLQNFYYISFERLDRSLEAHFMPIQFQSQPTKKQCQFPAHTAAH